MYDQDSSERSRSPGDTGHEPVRERVADVAETAKHEMGHVAHEVKSQAGRVASDLRHQLSDRARSQQHDLADRVRQAGSELREMAADREPSPARTAVEQLAGRSEQVADYLSKHSPEDLLAEVQEFARRRPGTFLVSAAVAGFVVGRLAKGVFVDRASGTTHGDSSTYRSPSTTAVDQIPAVGVAHAPTVEPTYAAGVAAVPPAPVTPTPVGPVVTPPAGGEPR
jgi:hypothetical protein